MDLAGYLIAVEIRCFSFVGFIVLVYQIFTILLDGSLPEQVSGRHSLIVSWHSIYKNYHTERQSDEKRMRNGPVFPPNEDTARGLLIY